MISSHCQTGGMLAYVNLLRKKEESLLSAMRYISGKERKLSILIPCDFEDAERLDRGNRNSLWRDAREATP
jgi:hypothetical protein